MRKTEWYPGDVKPARPGVYERTDRGTGETFYTHWNGEFWGWQSSSPEKASENKNYMSTWQKVFWRGLMEPPK